MSEEEKPCGTGGVKRKYGEGDGDEEHPSTSTSEAERPETEEGEPTFTIDELIESYEEQEKDVVAVLGASDPKNCSYSKGYVKRQALYACLTCNPKNAPFFQPAGICLACSYSCHDGHDLVELYTKRNFRCDCGNKRFPDNPCLLQKDKDDFNERNKYNQNFSGAYCNCNRPYPDPDESSETASAMIQCIVCEDWFHTQHVLPEDEAEVILDDCDLICAECTPKLEFMKSYENLHFKKETAPTEKDVSEQKQGAESDTNSGNSQDSGISSLSEMPEKSEATKSETETSNEKEGEGVKICPLKDAGNRMSFQEGYGTVWINEWRKKICQCESCLTMYESLGVSFLVDFEDTMEHYEAEGTAKVETERQQAEETFQRQFQALGHVGQIEFLHGVNDMKEALGEFIRGIGNSGRVIEGKDIIEFFEELKRKRPRLDFG